MTFNMDKWLKRIWFTIGIVILLAGTAILAAAIIDIARMNDYDDERGIIVGDEKEEAEKKRLELQNIEFSMPDIIYGTDLYFINISQKDYASPKVVNRQSLSIGSGSDEREAGSLVNILIFNSERNYYKLLLNEKASINEMDYPSYDSKTLQKNIFYDISLKDTDGNGLINSNDNSEYFISDLDGSNFKKLKLDGYKVNQHEFADMYQSIYLLCSVIPKDKTIDEEYWERTLLEYDIKKGELIKHDNLNMLLSKAKEIMVK